MRNKLLPRICSVGDFYSRTGGHWPPVIRFYAKQQRATNGRPYSEGRSVWSQIVHTLSLNWIYFRNNPFRKVNIFQTKVKIPTFARPIPVL